IESVDPQAREIVVHRRAEGGVQVLQTKLPCLVTMMEGANTIRFAGMDDMFRAARCEIVEWDHKAAGIAELSRCGLKGSPTVVKKVFAPSPRAARAQRIEVGDAGARQAVDALLERLFAAHPSLEEEIAR